MPTVISGKGLHRSFSDTRCAQVASRRMKTVCVSIFYDDRKISVNNGDEISFRLDKEGDPNRGKFFTEPGVLFGDCRAVIDPNTQRLSEVRVYFGKRSFNILGINRHFRFAIGFYKKSKDYGPFQFSELRTNLAEFNVIARANTLDSSNNYELTFIFSM